MHWFPLPILLCIICGCSGSDPYESALKEKLSITFELADVIESVNDDASAKAAIAKIAKLKQRRTEIEKRLKTIPKPTPDKLKDMQHKLNADQLRAIIRLGEAMAMTEINKYPEVLKKIQTFELLEE